MKTKLLKILSITLAALLVLSACGTSQASVSEETAAEEGTVGVAATDADTMIVDESAETMTLDAIYFLDLGNESMMAACDTDEGVAVMGADYFVVLLNEAEIYNAAGEVCELADITRGSHVQIQWPGMVMESYPAQISAQKVTVLSDEVADNFPAEDEIPAINGGEKWWEPQPVTELPGLTIEYTTPDFAVCVFIDGLGTWSYEENGEGVQIASCGSHPLEMNYDDNNTIKRVGFDTIKLGNSPEADAMVCSAYVDGSEEAVDVVVGEDGTVELLEGSEIIYVVTCFWDAETYDGDATYAFKVIVPEES